MTASSEAALSVQLAETQQSLTRRTEGSANYHDHLQELVEKRTAELTQANKNLVLEIEERRRAEEALRESEERYRVLVDESYDVASSVKLDGTIIFVGPQLTRFGYTPDKMI